MKCMHARQSCERLHFFSKHGVHAHLAFMHTWIRYFPSHGSDNERIGKQWNKLINDAPKKTLSQLWLRQATIRMLRMTKQENRLVRTCGKPLDWESGKPLDENIGQTFDWKNGKPLDGISARDCCG